MSNPQNPTEFERELRELLNRTSQENESNTPDFILAEYLSGCLTTFNVAVQRRELWYGRGMESSTADRPLFHGSPDTSCPSCEEGFHGMGLGQEHSLDCTCPLKLCVKIPVGRTE